jgi:glycosyltransferase involved in cell wall biosynthesis
LVPYKKIDVLVDAFAEMPDKKLVVIGEGPEFARLRAKAGANVTLLGYQEAAALRDYLSRARAFLFAGREDFGIILVEAQACGTPVVAFGRGGAVETVCGLNSEEPTGVLFDEQTPEAVTEAIYRFEREEHLITAAACRENAMRFGIERFRREFGQFVEHQWRTFSDTVTQGAGPLRPGIASPAAIDRWTRSRRAA